MEINQLLDYLLSFQTILLILIIIGIKSSVKFVPQNRAWLVERFGKYTRTLEAGINFIVPFIDRVAADRSLKEQAGDVPEQSVITKDNITLLVDGVLYFRVIDPYKATYGVEDYIFAVTQLAQTTMRSELGKIDLDKTFEERDSLNASIVNSLNEAATPWGVQVLRYELKDIKPPVSVLDAMEQQMKAERLKRAQILESEGDKQSAINRAEGDKQARVLSAEAQKQEQILKAEGEAQAITRVAEAEATALETVGRAAASAEGQKAVQFDLAKGAIEAKQNIAKESSVVLLPDGATEIGNVVAQAMTIANTIGGKAS
ncbi:SPFH domain-containing protein [Alteromonas sp. CYL-A6]|uniref:SPFH domain-containing protein n=1 Tax=Alteromonas nitratireducens TaxID=3390813 RepID=UPI0034AE7284